MATTKIFSAKGLKGATGLTGTTGATGLSGPRVVSTDAGNTATLGSDSLIYVPQPSLALASASQSGLLKQVSGNTTDLVDGSNNCQNLVTAAQPTIWYVRQRSWNAINNPNFEVDQRNVGGSVTINANGTNSCLDRWVYFRSGTLAATSQQITANVIVPGTNYSISSKALRITLTTQQASLAAGDYLIFQQYLEGPYARPLVSDVTSATLLVRSSIAPLKFAFIITDGGGTFALAKLCTIPGGNANTWTLIPFPNLPVYPGTAGNFPIAPGGGACRVRISLAAGSSSLPSANDIWQSTFASGAIGMDNWAANPVNSTFDIGFVQWEPGSYCSSLIECPFPDNLSTCQRYFCKSNPYANLSPTNGDWQALGQFVGSTSAQTTCRIGVTFPVEMAQSPTMTIYDNTGVAAHLFVDGLGTPSQAASVGLVYANQWGQATLGTGQILGGYSVVLGQWRADLGNPW